MRQLSAFGLLLGLSACASMGRNPAPLAVIDAHTHADFDGKPEAASGILFTREQYLQEMGKAGVVGAVAHTDEYEKGYADLREHGVVHCAGIRDAVDAARLEAGLRSGRYACVKIYLGYVYRYAHDPIYDPVYRLAETYDVPVVFHTGDTYEARGKLKYADPLTIDEVAVDHPKVNFVLAHCGNPWIQSAAEVAYKNPNVYLDSSALLIGRLNELPRETVDEYLVRPLAWVFGYLENPSKLMFGSDWPLSDMASSIEAVKRAIPKQHWRAVFHDNAADVFKIKPSKGPLRN